MRSEGPSSRMDLRMDIRPPDADPVASLRLLRSFRKLLSESEELENVLCMAAGAMAIGALVFFKALLSGGCPWSDPVDEPGRIMGGLLDIGGPLGPFEDSLRYIGCLLEPGGP
jgi:hypothetical protein